jgi:hypothetical protein
MSTITSGNYWIGGITPTSITAEAIRQHYGLLEHQQLGTPYGYVTIGVGTQSAPDGQQVLALIKKSVKEIEVEPFTAEVRKNIIDKVERLQKCGASKQALVLEAEVTVRNALVEIKRLGYKVLTRKAIGDYENANKMTLTKDGIKIHIDPIDDYTGNPAEGTAKDRIIPDSVLTELEKANENQVFDEVKVLWVEKVKDPILLGCIDGCEDFFYITEWGDDISFEQIQRGEGK